MRLKRRYVDIKRVIFDHCSYIQDGVLHVCRGDLEQLASDHAFSKVEFDLAEPGTECRLMNVSDVVQPTVRLGREDATFPGVSGTIGIAGDGISLNLRNVLVTEILEVPVTIGCFLDMWGPAAEYSDLSKSNHITIDEVPAEHVSEMDYQKALHCASKRVARFLAELAKDQEPDEEVTFTLERERLEGLPKVAYLCGVFCQAPMTDTTIYGESMQSSMPVLVHPNEVLDGAVTDRNYGNLLNADPTCVWQNHPVIMELYRRHGVDLNFAGVVLVNTPHTVEWKRRNALMAASMIKHHMGADCCIITKEGGGNAQIDSAIALEALERDYKVKCTLILTEFVSMNNASREQLLFSTDAADAMVSTGCVMPVEVPVCGRVIGHTPIAPAPGFTKGNVVPQESFIHRNRAIRGALSQLGWSWYGSKKF